MPKRPIPRALALSAGALLVAAPAAGELPQGPDPTPCIGPFEGRQAEYLADERYDRTEFEEIRGDWFLVWDLDRSGFVEEEELTSCYDRIGLDLGEAATLYREWDVDGDPVLLEDEFFGPDVYTDLDADRSGFLDSDEFIR